MESDIRFVIIFEDIDKTLNRVPTQLLWNVYRTVSCQQNDAAFVHIFGNRSFNKQFVEMSFEIADIVILYNARWSNS